jgi:hypothetical protein
MHLGQLLIGQPKRVELVLGPILDEARLIELDPGRALLGQPLDDLAVDGEQGLDQVEPIEVGGDSVGRLPEQQERDGPQDHRHGVDAQLLHRLGVLVERLRGGEREGGLRPQLRDDVVVVGVEPLRHLHRRDVDALLLSAAGHREVGFDVDVAAGVLVAVGHGADERDHIEDVVVEREVVRRDQVHARLVHEPPVVRADPLGRRLELVERDVAAPVALGRELQLAVRADARKAGDVG